MSCFFLRKSAGLLTLAIALWLYAGSTSASTLTDQVLEQLLEQHLPHKVYEKANNPWPGGSYALTVFKDGAPTVVSRADKIRVQMPMNIVINGDASASWLGLTMSCKANFDTTGEVVFTPRTSAGRLTLNATIDLPIPPVMANCDKMQIPLENSLRALVSQYKGQWEQRIASEANAWLTAQSAPQ